VEIYAQVIILGIVQGLAEFFPVSSSGHLILAQHFMSLEGAGVFVDLLLHGGTLLAVLFFLRQEILLILRGLCSRGEEGRKGRRLILLVLAASLPTAIIGFSFRSVFIGMFQSMTTVGLAFILTSIMLLLTRVYPGKDSFDIDTMPWRLALLIGAVQGLAITPGLSRSGATISIALLLGVKSELAFKFSFLLSIPAISGALLVEWLHLAQGDLSGASLQVPFAALLLGVVAAGLCGFIALRILGRLVNKGQLYGFAPYCLLLGFLTLIAG
jgi:undecaprenyl-diphosphatase